MFMGHNVRATLGKIARTNYQHSYQLKREFEFFKDCTRVLDLGCGDGEFVALSPDRIVGLDNNVETVRACVRKGLQAKHGSATKLPYKAGSFDGVHCAHLIEHLYPEDAYLMLQEVGRVLKPGGVFVLSTPLLWAGFFEDFTHVKPYYPGAIQRYLVHEPNQPTLEGMPYRFRQIELFYRYRPLWLPTRLGKVIGNWVYQYGVHSLAKDAYTLALQKLP